MLRERYFQIIWFFARVTVNIIFWDLILPRLGFQLFVVRRRPKRYSTIAKQFRQLAIKMGGVMIKVGQFLSSRADIFPIEITDELAGLQDEVPAENFADIREVAEADLGTELEQQFAYIDPIPLAAASLGQVHRAVLFNSNTDRHNCGVGEVGNPGELKRNAERFANVVVKIQRPNIETIISTDLSALRTVGGWLRRYKPIRKRADVPALLDEFESILFQEIDYLNEGRNVEIFAHNFDGVDGIRVPEVVWNHTTKRVLTLEDVGGIKINNFKAITDSGVSRREVASRLLDIYFKQIFEDGFFHADPHPGNLFVRPPDIQEGGSESWELALVDFGMVGVIKSETRHGLREMLVSIATRDTGRLTESYKTLDMLLPEADLELLERADKVIFDRFWGKDLSELREISTDEVNEFLGEFRGLIFNMPFQVPQDLIFLARAVGLLSGMCAGLDPQFNIWDHMAPYAQMLISQENVGALGDGFAERIPGLTRELGKIIQRLLALPIRTEAVLARVEQGNLIVSDRELASQVRHLANAVRLGCALITFSVLLLGSIQLYLNDVLNMSVILGIGAILVLILTILTQARN